MTICYSGRVPLNNLNFLSFFKEFRISFAFLNWHAGVFCCLSSLFTFSLCSFLFFECHGATVALHRLRLFPQLINQAMGDAISDLLLTILKRRKYCPKKHKQTLCAVSTLTIKTISHCVLFALQFV
jgi:hypothetical protein